MNLTCTNPLCQVGLFLMQAAIICFEEMVYLISPTYYLMSHRFTEQLVIYLVCRSMSTIFSTTTMTSYIILVAQRPLNNRMNTRRHHMTMTTTITTTAMITKKNLVRTTSVAVPSLLKLVRSAHGLL